MMKAVMFLACGAIFIMSANAQNGFITYTQRDSFDQPTSLKMYFNKNETLSTANIGKKERKIFLENGEELDLTNKQKAADQILKRPGMVRVNFYYFDEEGDLIYKNWYVDSLIVRLVNHFDPVVTIETKIPKIYWRLENEFKKIGGFNAQKASGLFRGREYNAWFTTEVPVNGGPWKLHGLPGLILEAYDVEKKVQYLFSSIEINTSLQPTFQNKKFSGTIIECSKLYDFLQESEEKLAQEKMTKATARGGALNITVGQKFKQELNFDDIKK